MCVKRTIYIVPAAIVLVLFLLWARPRGPSLEILDAELSAIVVPLKEVALREAPVYRQRNDRAWFDWCGIDLPKTDCPLVSVGFVVPEAELGSTLSAVDGKARAQGWRSVSAKTLSSCLQGFEDRKYWPTGCERVYKRENLHLELTPNASAEPSDVEVTIITRLGQ